MRSRTRIFNEKLTSVMYEAWYSADMAFCKFFLLKLKITSLNGLKPLKRTQEFIAIPYAFEDRDAPDVVSFERHKMILFYRMYIKTFLYISSSLVSLQ